MRQIKILPANPKASPLWSGHMTLSSVSPSVNCSGSRVASPVPIFRSTEVVGFIRLTHLHAVYTFVALRRYDPANLCVRENFLVSSGWYFNVFSGLA